MSILSGQAARTTPFELHWAGQQWWLDGRRAAFWANERILIAADLHLGKESSFRARAIPVPEGATGEALARLRRLVGEWSPERVVALGDLLHDRHSPVDPFLDWATALTGTRVTLVAGNHDRACRGKLVEAGIDVVDRLEIAGLSLVHDPSEAQGPALAGHLHPAFRLHGLGRQSVRRPCWWLHGETLIFPSFGDFTGGSDSAPEAGDRVFLAAADRVVEITGTAA